ncbi:hypothetical protein BOX15_Mlig021993g2, partial [Macrostomum lignano]
PVAMATNLQQSRRCSLAITVPDSKDEAVSPSSPCSICRICHESAPVTGSDTGSDSQLCQPCQCRGTVAHVHLACLFRWLQRSGYDRCELCQQPFSIGLSSSKPQPPTVGGSSSAVWGVSLRLCLAVLALLCSGRVTRHLLGHSGSGAQLASVSQDIPLGCAVSIINLTLIWTFASRFRIPAPVAELLGVLVPLESDCDEAEPGVCWYGRLPNRLIGLALANSISVLLGCYAPWKLCEFFIGLIDSSASDASSTSWILALPLLVAGAVATELCCGSKLRPLLLPPAVFFAAPIFCGLGISGAVNYWNQEDYPSAGIGLVNCWIIGAVCLCSARHLLGCLTNQAESRSDPVFCFCFFDAFFSLADASWTAAARALAEVALLGALGVSAGAPVACLLVSASEA